MDESGPHCQMCQIGANNLVAQLLAEFVPKSQTIQEIFIESSALKNLPEKLLHHFGLSKVKLIADENTWSVAGLAAQKILKKAGYTVEKILFPANPRPRPIIETARTLSDELRSDNSIPIVVGTGVLNDLVKFAAFKAGQAYCKIRFSMYLPSTLYRQPSKISCHTGSDNQTGCVDGQH